MRPYVQGRELSFRTFYFRRFMRVLPAYLAILALYFSVPSFREQPNISPLWRFLTFTQNFGLGIYSKGAFSHAWSLCVEEHFYLLLPLIVFALMKKPRITRVVLLTGFILALGFVIRWWLWAQYLKPMGASDDAQFFGAVYLEKIYYPTYTRLDGLLVGVLLAAIQLFRPNWWSLLSRKGNTLALAGIAVLCLCYPICRHIASFSTALIGYPLLAIAYGLLVAATASGGCALARYRVWGATTVSTLAYSIYLTHKQIMHLDHLYLGSVINMDGLVGTIIYLVTIVSAAALLYACVERPFLRARDRIGRRELRRVAAGTS